MLTPVQKRFVLDPHRRKIARASRRSGKTFVDAAYLIYECLKSPNTPVLYAGLTRDSAKEAVWDILIAMLDGLDVDYDAKPSALMITFPNGSKITIFGCDTQNARNRLRGRKFKLIIFDETGFYAALDPLVYAVLPMLADMGGTLALTSSPGELLEGLFFEADQGDQKDEWSRYFWTIFDNPLFQKAAYDAKYKNRAEEELELVLKMEFKGDRGHPSFRREWLGEWVEDKRSLVYPVTVLNLIDGAIAQHDQMHVFGLNLDSPVTYSLLVGRFSTFSRDFQVIDQFTKSNIEFDELAGEIGRLNDIYKPVLMLANTGKFSKEIVEDFRRRYKYPVQVMPFKDISYHQRTFANDIEAGNVKVVRGLPILKEYDKIVRNSEGHEIEGQANSASLAVLAMYRKVYQTVLQNYEPPLSEDEAIIKRLEDSRDLEEAPWYERLSG
jgi:terminase large subunit-like protein